MRKIATIDIGSNSIKLLIASISKSNRVKEILQINRIPCLAEGLKKTGIISQANLNRAIRDLNYFKDLAQQNGADEIYAAATQALRKAKNQKAVLQKIYRETGIKVEVISGKREALLTYRGALTGIGHLQSDRIVFDVGGASTEFVLAQGEADTNAFSIPIGVVEITEKYRTDRITRPEKLAAIISEQIEFLRPQIAVGDFSCFKLISCGGTVSAFKLLKDRPAGFNPELIHGKTITRKTLLSQLHELAGMKLSERKGVITFEPSRAKIIVAGGILLLSVMEIFKKNSMKVSARNLRWGFLLSKL